MIPQISRLRIRELSGGGGVKETWNLYDLLSLQEQQRHEFTDHLGPLQNLPH